MIISAVLTALVSGVLSENTELTPVVPHNEIKIRFYYDSEFLYVTNTLGQARTLFSHEHYNTSLPVIMVIHGHDQDQESLIGETIHALFSRGLFHQYNIFAVKLPEQFSLNVKNIYYLRPALNVPLAGEALGEFFNEAIDRGFITPDQINIISFSLGAQIAGYVGRRVTGLINSITGIDPAGTGFDLSRFVTKLIHVSQQDAKYVHLYHSNSVFMGTSRRLGTVEYLFNGGNTQPGCNSVLDPLCNHMRGFIYYHMALRLEHGSPAVQCNSFNHLKHCKCHGNRISYVGFPLDYSAHGVYVLRTLAYPPYLLGNKGIKGFRCKNPSSAYERMMTQKYDKIMNFL